MLAVRLQHWTTITPSLSQCLVFAGCNQQTQNICIIFVQRLLNVFDVGPTLYPANTKHLYNICTTSAQRLRCWTDIVQMLYKCFVFAGICPLRSRDREIQHLTLFVLNSTIHQNNEVRCFLRALSTTRAVLNLFYKPIKLSVKHTTRRPAGLTNIYYLIIS